MSATFFLPVEFTVTGGSVWATTIRSAAVSDTRKEAIQLLFDDGSGREYVLLANNYMTTVGYLQDQDGEYVFVHRTRARLNRSNSEYTVAQRAFLG